LIKNTEKEKKNTEKVICKTNYEQHPYESGKFWLPIIKQHIITV